MRSRLWIGLVALAIFSCNGDDTPVNPVDPPEHYQFNASAFIEVINEDGEPVEGARVNLGSNSATADLNGIAYLKDVEMATTTLLTVDKAGYFRGSRRFYPKEGRTSYLRVMLLEPQVLGEFSATDGGKVEGEGIQFEFPAGSVVDLLGNDYSGNVIVSAQIISADDPALSDKMPGDLVGMTQTDELQVLASFGMIAVDIYSDIGVELRIAQGEAVSTTIDIPSNMQSSAPTEIPVWSFDESEGVWVEEGVAILEGGSYVAELPHFSWWNWDLPYEIVDLTASFVFDDGEPAGQLLVCATIESVNFTDCIWTNSAGEISGPVPQGEVLVLSFHDHCFDEFFTMEIGPFNENTALGQVTISNSSAEIILVSGDAVNCEGSPVTDGYVYVASGSVPVVLEIQDDGTFSGTVVSCTDDEIGVFIFDHGSGLSVTAAYGYQEVIETGTMTVCDALPEGIVLHILGLDTILTWANGYATTPVTADGGTLISDIYDFDTLVPDTVGTYFHLTFPGVDTGTYTDNVNYGLLVAAESDSVIVLTGVFGMNGIVNVTEYGDEGGLVKGTFSGSMAGISGGPYPCVGSFSVTRD